jgi:16S rRNA (cytosine1402-N4)-methyltransferase
MTMNYPHEPVLLHEVVKALSIISEGIYVDCTVGTGGHSEAIARKLGTNGRLVCLDRDPDAVRISKERLDFLGGRLMIAQSNFADLSGLLHGWGIERVHGVLLDLGMSSYQLERAGRGFSFLRDEPLDMRMDPGLSKTAFDLVNTSAFEELESYLRMYGQEKRARVIARKIVKSREENPIRTSRELAELVKSISPFPRRGAYKHPATRTFQALRIAVNQELELLKTILERLPPLMLEGGRVVVISYHSLEDRIVKRHMEKWEHPCTCPPDFPHCVCGKKALFRRVQKKPVRPGFGEVARNPRARSAIMRVAERVCK